MTTTTNPVIQHVADAPDGIVRLFVPDGFEVSKRDLRNAAAKAAGTIDVGRTPAPRVATYKGVKGHGYSFSPVTKRQAGEDAPTEVAEAPAEDPRAAVLRSLGLPEDAIATALAVADGASAPAPEAKSASKGKSSSFRDQVLVPRARAREAAAKRCGKCLGFGRVRSHPRDGAKFPYAFKTASGAAKAPTGVLCDACQGKRKTA